jgi:replicative DNA helicase
MLKMYDLELEMAILSTIFTNLSLAYEINQVDFYYPVTKFIAGILITLATTTPTASKEYAFSSLMSSPHSGVTDLQIEQAVLALKKQRPSTSFVKDVDQLRKLSHMRAFKSALVTSDNMLNEGDFNKAKVNLFETIMQLGNEEANSITTALSQPMDELFPAEQIGFVPSGFDVLDHHNGGFGNQELIILAADSGSGKSTLMQIMATSSIRYGYNPVYFNLEMSAKNWFSRYFSHIGKLSHTALTLHAVSLDKSELDKIYFGIIDLYGMDDDSKNELRVFYEKKKPKLRDFNTFFNEAKKIAKIRNNDITVISSNVSSVTDIFQKTNALRKNNRCDIIYVDYVNMLLNSLSRMTTAEKLAQIALDLKNLSKSLNIPVIAAAQWNKSESDVKYSKAIRETADTLYNWREYFPGGSVHTGFSTSGVRYFVFGSIKARNSEPIQPKIMEADFGVMSVDISEESPPPGAIEK